MTPPLRTPAAAATAPLIVPGIQGYGTAMRGAYAGSATPDIYMVTTLSDSGSPGSLRHALETATGPRIVIPEVGGYVDLQDALRVHAPYVNVWGQCAPSPGLHLRRYGIELTARQVLFQHFSIRPGEWGTGYTGNCGLIAYGADCRDIALDHMSIAWGPDENFAADTYYNGDMNFTMSHCLSTEGLHMPASVPVSQSHGALAQSASKMVTLDRCFLGTNVERNPYWQGGCRIAVVNCVQFNGFCVWFFLGTCWDINGNQRNDLPWSAMALGNVSIAGQGTFSDHSSPYGVQFAYNTGGGISPGCRMYRHDNIIVNTYPNSFYEVQNDMGYPVDQPGPLPELPIAPFAPMPSGQVEAYVYANAGARPLDRYPHDARCINESQQRRSQAGYINHQDQVGGYSPLTPGSRKLTLPANPHQVTASGYTNLEIWAQQMAAALQPGGSGPTPPVTTTRSGVLVGGVAKG